MEYVAGPLPKAGSARVDYRSASNGYAPLYEQQQSREDGASFQGQGIDTENLLVESEVHGQPDGYAMHLAYDNQGSDIPPIGVEDHFDHYMPGFQEGSGPHHNPMLADDYANLSNNHSAWADGDQTILSEAYNELESADIMYNHHDGLQQHNGDIMYEPDGCGVVNGAGFHNAWHSVPSLAPPNRVEAASIAQCQVDDPRLSHFWTPHKLY